MLDCITFHSLTLSNPNHPTNLFYRTCTPKLQFAAPQLTKQRMSTLYQSRSKSSRTYLGMLQMFNSFLLWRRINEQLNATKSSSNMVFLNNLNQLIPWCLVKQNQKIEVHQKEISSTGRQVQWFLSGEKKASTRIRKNDALAGRLWRLLMKEERKFGKKGKQNDC